MLSDVMESLLIDVVTITLTDIIAVLAGAVTVMTEVMTEDLIKLLMDMTVVATWRMCGDE